MEYCIKFSVNRDEMVKIITAPSATHAFETICKSVQAKKLSGETMIVNLLDIHKI
jgi:hypothetical protein